MKKVLILAGFVLSTLLANAQISDVRIEGSWIRVYDENNSQISYMNSYSMSVDGVSSSFFVATDGKTIRVYDKNCNQISYMYSQGMTVRGASGSTFTVMDRGLIRTYDKNCNHISYRKAY